MGRPGRVRGMGPRPTGAMAQLVAHLLCKQGVRGSSPLGSTHFPLSNLLSALARDVNLVHLQQQPAAVGLRSSFCKGQRVSGRESLQCSAAPTVDRFHRGVMTRERAHRHSGASSAPGPQSARWPPKRTLCGEVASGRPDRLSSTNRSSAHCSSSQITST
jgi:hypothetical protein